MLYRPKQIEIKSTPNVNVGGNQKSTEILFSNGDFVFGNGQAYVGKYYYKNNIAYSGDINDLNSKQLFIPLDQSNDIYDTYYFTLNKKRTYNYKEPVAYIPIPDDNDYTTTFIVRYFVKRRNSTSSNIIEVNQKQYNTIPIPFQGIDEVLYYGIQLDWKIYGCLNDKYDNSGKTIVQYGIYNTNKRTLQLKEREMSGISRYLSNLIQFSKIIN
jgi:hypothetical protein